LAISTHKAVLPTAVGPAMTKSVLFILIGILFAVPFTASFGFIK
jgi:hypothetical protein